jgi:hypothetical protein
VPQAPRRLQVPPLHRIQGIAEDVDRQDPEVHTAGDGEGGVSRDYDPQITAER